MRRSVNALLIAAFLMVSLVFGCTPRSADMEQEAGVYHSDSEAPALMAAGSVPAAAPKDEAEIFSVSSEVSPAGAGRMVVYTGSMYVVVANIESSLRAVQAAAESLGGYMQSLGSTSITVKVPAARFNEMVAEVEKLGEVTGKDISGEDVTDELRDLKVRLDNAEEVRKRLVRLLDRAEKMEDALLIERELERVTETIELLKGRIRSLEHSVAYSVLTVRLNSSLPQERVTQDIPFPWVRELGSDLTGGTAGDYNPRSSYSQVVKFDLPESYIMYYQGRNLARAMSADNVFVLLARHENFKGGSLEFWSRLIRRHLVENRAFLVEELTEVALDTKVRAKEMVAIKDIGREKYGYLIGVVSTDDYVYTYEAWGPESGLKADRQRIERSMKSMKIKP